MKPQERDDLLIRIDERTRNIWRLTDQQEKHLSKINDSLLEHAVQITSNSNGIKWLRWVIGIGLPSITAIVLWLVL